MPLPKEFLDWQVAPASLHTMTRAQRRAAHRGGADRRDRAASVAWASVWSSHSVVCGLLPHPRLLDGKTHEFERALRGRTSTTVPEGRLRRRHRVPARLLRLGTDDFDPGHHHHACSPKNCAIWSTRCAPTRSCSARLQRIQRGLDPDSTLAACAARRSTATVRRSTRTAPVYDNVWWHNTLFHGNGR